MPGKLGILLRATFYRFQWRTPVKVEVGLFSQFLSPNRIQFNKNTSLGKSNFFSADGGSITIGNNFSTNINCHLNASVGGNINIGDNVLIGPNVVIRTANHNYNIKDLPINKQGHKFADINIENNVWIGANVVILGGVKIGEGSVIAAGAVVNRNIDPYTVSGGVPVRFIKKIES